jgi:glutathione reductase (NADPH)
MSAHDHDYDLFVIGGGSGGVRAARVAAGLGVRVGLAEQYRMGGTCVIRGCVPKKLLVYASRFADEFEDAAGFGWTVPDASFDWPSLIAAKDREILRLEGVYRSNLDKAGVEIIDSRAELTGAHSVRLVAQEREVTARTILVATGGKPNRDEKLPGIEHVITSNGAFHLETLPRRIVIAGGGYIACEFASIFNGLGAETTLIYRGQEILRGFDNDLRSMLHHELESRGVTVVCGEVFSKIEKTADGLAGHTTGGRELVADEIMFAIGRSPNTEGLGLETAGVAVGEGGKIVVDEYSRTLVPHIYAIGDVTDRVNLTPVAIREGMAFVETAFNDNPTPVDHAHIPTAVFTSPEIGTIGLTEEEACERLDVVDIYRTTFRPMKLSLTEREERTLMKLVVDGQTDRVVGCHLLGPDSGELIQVVGIAVRMGATKADFDATMAVHPTAAEELVTMRTPTARHIRDAAE